MMPLLEPTIPQTYKPVKCRLSQSLQDEMMAYMSWAKFDSLDDFLEKAVQHVLDSDKKWRKFKHDTE